MVKKKLSMYQYIQKNIKIQSAVPKTKISTSELKQLENLYNIRDSIDEKDFESWKSTILKESKLPEEEMLAVLELLGFKKEVLVYIALLII